MSKSKKAVAGKRTSELPTGIAGKVNVQIADGKDSMRIKAYNVRMSEGGPET